MVINHFKDHRHTKAGAAGFPRITFSKSDWATFLIEDSIWESRAGVLYRQPDSGVLLVEGNRDPRASGNVGVDVPDQVGYQPLGPGGSPASRSVHMLL